MAGDRRSASASRPAAGASRRLPAGLILALALAMVTSGCIGGVSEQLASQAIDVDTETVQPAGGQTQETRWHTDLRRGTLTNTTGASDDHRFEVPNGTVTVRLGLQSQDGNVTACIQTPTTRQKEDGGWCSAQVTTTHGKATWEADQPETGTWAVIVERRAGEQGNLTYALTIRHELPEDAPPPDRPRQTEGEDRDPEPTEPDPSPPPIPEPEGPRTPTDAVPHVIVGLPDSGINPYHEIFHRPHLTQHPCSYIEGFPCSIPKLPLSIGEHDTYDAAVEADQALWERVEPGQVYWIPRTNIVAAACDPAPENDFGGCILDPHGHGTGTASSVLTENPDALLAIDQGDHEADNLDRAGIPIDIYSVSWGTIVPLPLAQDPTPIYVVSAGNDPRTTLIDGWAGHPRTIAVGGAYAQSDAEEGMAAKQPEVVSYYCRPTAEHRSVSGVRPSYCGTSFAAPTTAGALSKVLLGVRRSTGYTGTMADGMADPEAGLSIGELRDAMNRTASYDPDPRYENERITGVPLNPAAPWLQWGWGFYDGDVAEATLADLLGIAEAPQKPAEARTYMETQHTSRQALYG